MARRRRRARRSHPGFKAVQRKIARKYGMKRAGAILAGRTRRASSAAKRRNPRLGRVKGTARHKRRSRR